jgi:transcriptional regulator with XRE-family HTH domain
MSKGQHWTERSTEDFVQRITFDFTTQIEQALEGSNSSQAALAKNLGVSDGRVSQILNNPGNIGLKNIVRYARAIGRKVAIVLYDDGDAANDNGPVNAEIFSTCWELVGRPADFFALRSASTRGFVQASNVVFYGTYGANFTTGYMTTYPPNWNAQDMCFEYHLSAEITDKSINPGAFWSTTESISRLPQ